MDYIAIKNRYRNVVKQAENYHVADINSDHVPVVSTIKMQLKNVKRQKQHKNLDYAALVDDKKMKLGHRIGNVM